MKHIQIYVLYYLYNLENMKLALNKMGDRATIPLINYTFDEVDLDKIFEYLEGSYGQGN